MSDEDWDELDLRVASAIRLCLTKNILANMQGISTAKELWEKLKGLYQAKGISNWLMLKEQFHTLVWLKYMKHILMYKKDTLNFQEVTSKTNSGEKRMKCESQNSMDFVMVTRNGNGGRKNHGKNVTYWKCGKFGHVKKNYPGGASLANGSELDANIVSLVLGEDDLV
ncbi:cytochrome p450 [Senna tora]|uniref:Cytochrome p450 n=1 Tax=Senna tora TaxID=362788 RepID=A0A834SFH4_9FABA|nr:cytochrome p450 [Senna tora]